MSRDNTSKLPLPEPPDPLTEAVARLVEPRVWETWDRRAEHKGWGPAERRLELALALDRPLSTMAASVEQARQIIVRVRADQEGQLGLPGWRCVNCKRVYECGQEPGRCECGATSWAHIDGTPLPVLVLGVEDEAAPAGPGLMGKCPVCLTANPCARHSYADQIRALDDPEYLAQLVERQTTGRVSDIEGHGA